MFVDSDDAELVTAAEEALQQLQASEHAAAASRASEVVERLAADHNEVEAALDGVFLGRPLPAQGQLQLQIQLQGPSAAMSFAVRFGVCRREARQKSRWWKTGQRSTSSVQPDKGISVEVTKGEQDERKTTTYKAQNEAELKKKHPEIHKLYRKYAADDHDHGEQPVAEVQQDDNRQEG